jgi:hypothetical protein
MGLLKRIDCTVRALLRAIDVTIALVKAVVVLSAALAGLFAVGAVVAYLKREQWTKPAYRWARDASGRWSFTPWAPAGADGAGPAPVAQPAPNDASAS